MQFNPDSNKQANEVIFSTKSNNCSHPPVTFNNYDIKKMSSSEAFANCFKLKTKLFMLC